MLSIIFEKLFLYNNLYFFTAMQRKERKEIKVSCNNRLCNGETDKGKNSIILTIIV